MPEATMLGGPCEPEAITCDYLWRGRLCFWQPAKRHGYRFNLDPVLLSGFAQTPPHAHVMDFGAGCGIVGIMLLAQNKAAHITAVEVQPELAALIVRNAEANGVADRLNVIVGDLRHAELPKVDAVVFNPPYYPAAQFRPCAHPGRDQGRREQNGTLGDFIARALGALGQDVPSASISAIVPAVRFAEVCTLVHRAGGVVSRAREVWPRAQGRAAHVLVEARRPEACTTSMHARLSDPLVLHVGDGRDYTPQINAWVDGPLPARA